MGLANISIVGNVVRPPSQTALSNGSIKTTMVVAVDTYKKGAPDNRSAEFYKVEVWGRLADVAYRFIAKGNQVTAVGRFAIDRWVDRDGKERSTGVINASEISIPQKRAALDESALSQEGHSDPGMSPATAPYPSPPASAATPSTGAATIHHTPSTGSGPGQGIPSNSLRVPPTSAIAPPSAAAPYGVETDELQFSEAEEDAATAEMYKHALGGTPLSDAEAEELFGAA